MPKQTKKNHNGDSLLFDGGFMSSRPRSWNEPRKCVICGAEYLPNMARQKTCGKQCSAVYYSQQKKLKQKVYWERYKERRDAGLVETKDRGKRKPVEARHNITRAEAVALSNARQKRKDNMAEVARIAMESGGDYGKWVALNDR